MLSDTYNSFENMNTKRLNNLKFEAIAGTLLHELTHCAYNCGQAQKAGKSHHFGQSSLTKTNKGLLDDLRHPDIQALDGIIFPGDSAYRVGGVKALALTHPMNTPKNAGMFSGFLRVAIPLTSADTYTYFALGSCFT